MTRDVRHWDRMSGAPYALVEKMSTQETFRRLIRTTLRLAPGDRVLDLGCGTGAYLDELRAAVGESGHVLAVDYSPKMVAKARARAAAWDNVEVRQADATTLDLEPESFDAVLASFSISATQDVPATVDGIHRVLRPGGRLFAPDMRLVPGGPLSWGLGVVYRSVARWTGVDVLDTVRATFGAADIVNPDGVPLPTLPRLTPVVMITATKDQH
jgi:ubiquinone/menaquinone biosynthesis C-methylase UbiE